MEKPIPLYRDLNEKSKKLGNSDDNWKRFPYKGWWYMLHYALKTVPSTPARIQPLAKVPLYRGVSAKVKFSPDGLEDEMLYSFNHFASTSTSKAVALQFAGEGGTLIELGVVPLVALGVKAYSALPHEDEVLLGPWSTFEFIGTRMEGKTTCVGLMSAGPTITYTFD